jgi:Protein of unknown function (DUF2795)
MVDAYTRRVYLTRIRDFVGGAAFPATRAQVLAYAEKKNTPSDIIGDLNRVLVDRFDSLDAVVQAIDALRFGAASR